MEELDTLLKVVNQMGFPIAAFLLMWHTHNKTLKKLTEAIEELKLCMNRKK
jgi:hypothetical protein